MRFCFGMRSFVLSTTLCVLLAACGSGGSSSSGVASVGASCSSGMTCTGGLCASSQDFPGGYCTQGCSPSDPSSCPTGSVCIDDASGVPQDAGVSSVCYQACQSNSDCRSGYACLEKANHMVCRNGG